MKTQSPMTPKLLLAKALVGVSGGALVWVFQRTATTVDVGYGFIASCAIIGLIVGDLLRRQWVLEEPPASDRGRVGFRTEQCIRRHYQGRRAHAGGQRGTEAFRNE